MPRANAMVPPDAIRIEDEVWQEAFTRREPARPNRRRRLEAIDGGGTRWSPQPSAAQPQARATVADASSTVTDAPPPITDAPLTVSAAVSPARETSVALAPPPPHPPRPVHAPPERRTIKIQGRGAERHLPVPDPARRRPQRRPYERAGFRPDRVAMWAVVLGLLLLLVALASGHG